MTGSLKAPGNKTLRRSDAQSSRKSNINVLNNSQFLVTLVTNITSIVKILLLVVLILAIIFVIIEMYSPQGIVILPFETGTDKILSGTAMADQITAELVRIQKIQNTNYDKEIIVKDRTEWLPGSLDVQSLGEGNVIVPKEELIKFSLADTGTMSTSYGSLDPGKFIIAFKDICPGSKPDNIIRGSLQRYGSTIVLVAVFEGDVINSWSIKRTIDDDEGQISEIIKDLAYMIALDMPDSQISAKTWEGFKYYTEALDAYNQYKRTNDPEELLKASNYSLKSIEFEREYQNPYDLLQILEFRYISLNDSHKAKYFCNRTIELNNKSEFGWHNKGIVYHNLMEYNESIEAYKKAIEINGSYDTALNNLGCVLEERNPPDYKKSIKYIDKAIKVSPENTNYLYNKGMILYMWGSSSGNNNSLDDAIKTFNRVIEIDPNYKYAFISKGIVLYELEQYNDAIKSFNKAIRIDSEDHNAWYYKGIAFNQLEQYDNAIKAFDKAIEIKSNDADTLISKGWAHYKLEQYDEAISAYNKAIEIDPNNTDTRVYKSWAFLENDTYDEAIKTIEEAIRIDPKYAEAWRTKGIILNESGQRREAIKAFNKSIEMLHKTNTTNSTLSDIWKRKGNAYYQLKEYDDAIEAFEEAIRFNEHDTDAMVKKSLALFENKMCDEAMKTIEEAIRIDPKNADAWRTKGMIQNASGQHLEATISFIEANILRYLGVIPDPTFRTLTS